MRHAWALVLLAGCGSSMAENERFASAALKTLASASADFRGNDRDNNKVQDFWTGDVASFYYLTPVGGTEPIRLIEKGVADADPSRPGAKPYHGYWFAAMEKDETGEPYGQDTKGDKTAGQTNRNHSKFGFCAYPAEYGYTGGSCFYINEGNTIFKFDTQGKPILKWPTDEEILSGGPAAAGPPLPLIDATSKLSRTSIVPVLQTPHDGRNLIWCATFELAWQELGGYFKGDPALKGGPGYVTHLNAKTVTKADLDPSWYLARAGTVGAGILKDIEREMKGRFPEAPLVEMLPAGPHDDTDVFAFAYLLRNLPFAQPFGRYDRPFTFGGKDVHAFGVWKGGPRQSASSQARLLFYESPTRFAVELKTSSDLDRLILARIPKKGTLLETVREAADVALKSNPGKMEEGDELLVPCLNFDLRKSYKELAKPFSAPPAATPYGIDQAYQAILFRLDETGAKLESWAGIYSKLNGDTPPPPRKIFFDGPFLLTLMKSDAKTPYFAIWIEDPEILPGR
ncbi:MAG TPA: DUF2950 family protein [Planctomycetota bacterium]